jgi:phosphatidylserine/phosphatidylglycerophosphate/cardiolipin synthase-like enzyme
MLKYMFRAVLFCVFAMAIRTAIRSFSHAGLPAIVHNLGSSPVSASSNEAPTKEFYCPNENCEQVDESLLRNSSNHIDIAMYAFTDRRLADELVERANHGVKVRLYRDSAQYNQEVMRDASVFRSFTGNPNISIRVKGNRRDLMHLKAWSDGEVLREGSANWSIGGEKYQDNSLFVLRDQESITAFERKFDEMWSRPGNQIVQ